MSSLRRDLLERKLWIVVAVLIAAVVAVPVLLLKSASASSAPTLPAPPAAATGATTPTTSTTSQTSTTTSAEPAKVELARIARNPFATSVPKLSVKPSTTTGATGSSASASTGSTASSGSSTVSMVSPTPATGSATVGSTGSSSAGGSSSSSASTPTTTTPTTPTSTIASTSPTPLAGNPVQAPSWTIYSISVRFGNDWKTPVHNDIPRLTALPSAGNPQLMFFGVMSGGRQAVFGLGAGVAHAGRGLCRPSRSSCSAIVLSAGQSEAVAWPTATGGMAQAVLQVVKITSRITHSRKEALKAYNRVSEAGICDLSLAQPVNYNPDTGTVQNFPKDACKAQASSAPFAFLKTTP